MSDFNLIINGEKVAKSETFDVINPATEEVVAACALGTNEDVDAAVAAARAAFPDWSSRADGERAEALNKIAELIKEHHAELVDLLVQEQGKPVSGPGANMEIGGCAVWTKITAGFELPVEVIDDNDTQRIEMYRKPVGVVGSITPWNWPALIAIWHIVPAVRTGCTVVIKPSSFTPLSTIRLVELMNEVLPAGVVNLVTGEGGVGGHMTSHPDIDKIVFTGSINTGKHIMENAAPTLKRLVLELGGNDAGIILPGTDVDPLLEQLFWGAFINTGQTCAALKRLYVHESDYNDVCEKLTAFVSNMKVGNGAEEDSMVGPLTNEAQFGIVRDFVEDAKAKGGRVLCGGEAEDKPGYFYPLTLVADATDDMKLVKDEQFGPALPIIKYSDLDEVIERANSLEVGLGGSVWGNNTGEAARIAGRLECGTAWVNKHGELNPMAPFGGVKCSGIGVEFGPEGLKEYTTVQVLNIAK